MNEGTAVDGRPARFVGQVIPGDPNDPDDYDYVVTADDVESHVEWNRLSASLKLIEDASAVGDAAYHATWESLGGWDGDLDHVSDSAHHSVCRAAREARDAAFIDALQVTAECWKGDKGLRAWNGLMEPIMKRRARYSADDAKVES